MSRYIPKLEELRTEQDGDGCGWWVCDQFGRIDGPYETELMARATFHAEAALGHDDDGWVVPAYI